MTRTPLHSCIPLAMLLAFGACDCSDEDDPVMGTDAGMDSGPPPGDGSTNVCGDGIVRGGETCDDGNTADGDGCSADCLSDESCGNGVVDTGAGEQCDDGNTADGDACRGDCGSDYSCGNGVVDTAAEGASADEVCDDGNSVNGDGCSADCLSDESCGNGVVDIGAGEVCDDGNTDEGDDCSADCMTSLLCGNGTIDGVEECDDGNTTDGDGCDMTCRIERCGNGMVDAGEACDDGNMTNGDGCEADCTFTCSADGDCDDAEECNGTETCANAGTDTSMCVAGTMLADGTSCGAGGTGVCNGGVCAAAGCGDSTVTAPEECDDGNTTAGDGCENDCTWTCDGAADCDDAEACNGAETCTMPGTLMSRCAAGTALVDGAACDRDMMAGTRDICRAMTCVASACGDGFVDSGSTPAEMCDDGNTMSGDGCSSTCQMEAVMPPTGFRVTSLRLISPRIVASIPLGGCQDITDNCPSVFGSCAADSVNTLLQNAVGPMSAGGDYSLHIVNLFRPLNPAAASTPAELHLNATCMEAPTPDECSPDAMPDTIMSNANNMTTGTCYMPVAADVNTRAGTPAAYTPTANTVSGPCFISDEEMLVVDISGIMIPLERARVAATYSGSPPNRLISGSVTGFLSETAAADVTLPTDLPVVGGDPLYQHLQAGNRTATNSMGDSVSDGCNVGGATSEDDGDMNGSTRGFWFFLNFTADVITWTGT